MTYRVLVTGSRSWSDVDFIHGVLNLLLESMGSLVVVHGGAKGVDRIADEWARNAPDARAEVHPAAWNVYGKRAGTLRNQAMIDRGAGVVLAFMMPCEKSNCESEPHPTHGTRHCVMEAIKAGLTVRGFGMQWEPDMARWSA